MNNFYVTVKVHKNPKTGKPVATLDIETNALAGMTHYNGDRVNITIHAEDEKELVAFCDKIAKAATEREVEA